MDSKNEKAYRIGILRQALIKVYKTSKLANIARLRANMMATWGISPRTADEYISIVAAQERYIIEDEVLVGR